MAARTREARNFAAAILENTEVHWQEQSGLTEEELDEAAREMLRIAARIKPIDVLNSPKINLTGSQWLL